MRKRYEAGPPPTLGEVLDQGDALGASCERRTCMHRAPLDLADLVRRLGRATTVPDMRRRLSCTKCGGRAVAITRTPGSREYR